MKLSPDDIRLLEELCAERGVSAAKVLRLLEVEREYEFRERRVGVYEALREVLKTKEGTSGESRERA